MAKRLTRPARPFRLAAAITAALFVPVLVGPVDGASPGTNPFTEAVARFNLDGGKIESVATRGSLPANYVPTGIFYFFCSPPGDSETNTTPTGSLTVAPDGSLTGTCGATRSTVDPNGLSVAVVKSGTLSGKYDAAAQKVTFHFEGTSQYTYTQPPTCEFKCAPVTVVYNVVVDGPPGGAEVVGDRAEGTARHTFTCVPADWCPVTQQIGTSTSLVQFLPPLATAAPGVGQSTGGPAGGSPNNFILLLVLAGASFAVIAAAILWLRTRSARLGGSPAGTSAISTASPPTTAGPASAPPAPASPFAGATASAEGSGSPFAGATAAAGTSIDPAAAFQGATASGSAVAPAEGGDLGAFLEHVESAAEAGAVTPEDIDELVQNMGDPGPPSPPPPSPPSLPSPGTADVPRPKPPELEVTEDIVLAAELVDPPKPPVNPADLAPPSASPPADPPAAPPAWPAAMPTWTGSMPPAMPGTAPGPSSTNPAPASGPSGGELIDGAMGFADSAQAGSAANTPSANDESSPAPMTTPPAQPPVPTTPEVPAPPEQPAPPAAPAPLAAPPGPPFDPESIIAGAVAGQPVPDLKAEWEKPPPGPIDAGDHPQGAVGSDRSGGHEGQASYGESAGSAAPAADKAHEALVVADGQSASADESVTDPGSSADGSAVRDHEKDSGSEPEAR